MTHGAFMAGVEGYYGKYPRQVTRDMVAAYIADYSEADLDMLMREVVMTYSGQYRHTPDIAVFEQAKERVNSRSAIKRIGVKTSGERLIADMTHLTSGEIATEMARVKLDMEEREMRRSG